MRPVSIRAVEKRINRKLANEGQQLRKSRHDSRWLDSLGEHYIVNAYTNVVTDTHVPFGDLAYSLDVLARDEQITEFTDD